MIRVLLSRQPCRRTETASHRDSAVRQRLAFTLMETLVALALLGMIMASVSASIGLYWKYRTLSRDRISTAQIVRGIMEDLSCDLRACVNPSGSAVNPSLFPASLLPESMLNKRDLLPSSALPSRPTGLEKSLLVQEQQLNLSNPGTLPIHFVGTKNWIAVFTSTESPRFFADKGGYEIAQPRHIVWWYSDGSPLRVSLSQVGQRPSNSEVSGIELSNGLTRAVKPFSDSALPTDFASKQSAILVSDQIVAVQFRYFDGAKWHAEWNSATRFTMPRAVEVSLRLKGQDEFRDPFLIAIPQGS